MSTWDSTSPAVDIFNFVVVCREAQQVYLLGAFNDWSISATPMRETEQHVWQLSLPLPSAVADRQFSYFVIDDKSGTGRAPFGNTYLLPGTWAAVVRTRPHDEYCPNSQGTAV